MNRAVARLRQRRRPPPLILGQESNNSRMQENPVAVRILRIDQQISPPPLVRSGYGPDETLQSTCLAHLLYKFWSHIQWPFHPFPVYVLVITIPPLPHLKRLRTSNKLYNQPNRQTDGDTKKRKYTYGSAIHFRAVLPSRRL